MFQRCLGAIIALGLLVSLSSFYPAATALAGEICHKLPTAPGARLIVVQDEDQLGEAIGDPEALNTGDNTAFPTANAGDFICIAGNITLTAGPGITGANGANITVSNIVIYSATKADGTGFTVIGSGAGNPVFTFGYPAPAIPGPNASTYAQLTVNPTGSTLGDPLTIDCAGGTIAVDILPGANRSTVIDNRIGGISGVCTVAGVRVRADFDAVGNDQDMDDTDDDDLLENTIGVRVAANVFDPVAVGDYGPAIIVQEGVLGVADADNLPSAATATGAWDQCAGTYDAFWRSTSNHTIIGTTTGNATAGAAVNNPPALNLDDGNTISTGAGGRWAEAGGNLGAIENGGADVCIQGNYVAGAAGDPLVSGIYLAPSSQGTVVKGNSVGGWNNHGIEVQGPFKSEPPVRTGDSVHANLVGTASTAGANARDGIFCDDRNALFWFNTSNGNGDDGIDMGDTAEAEANDDGGCSKRAPVAGNIANSNTGNGFAGGSDFVNNTADTNGADGFFVPDLIPLGAFPQHRFCGNVAINNGTVTGDGFDVGSNNLFDSFTPPSGPTCRTISDGAAALYGTLAALNVVNDLGAPYNNVADNNELEGYRFANGNTFNDNEAGDNAAGGIQDNGFRGTDGNTLTNNFACGNTIDGFRVVNNNTFDSNTAGGDQSLAALVRCAGNGSDGFEVLGGNVLTRNTANGNTLSGFRLAGGGNRLGQTLAGQGPAGNNLNGNTAQDNGAQGVLIAGSPVGTENLIAGCNLIGDTAAGLAQTIGIEVGGAATYGAADTKVFGLLTGELAVLIDDPDGVGGIGGNVLEGNPPVGQIDVLNGALGQLRNIRQYSTDGNIAEAGETVNTNSTQTGGLAACRASGGGGGGPVPGSNMMGDVNLSSSFEQADVDLATQALRGLATLTAEQLALADVSRPCGKLTRADVNRMKASLKRIARGRLGLASQCSDRRVIGAAAAPAAPTAALKHAPVTAVKIYDISGRLLFEEALGPQVALSRAQRELANGVYLAVIATEHGREVRKFVVLR